MARQVAAWGGILDADAKYPMYDELPINQPTPEIAEWHERWAKNRDFVAGTDAVKAKGEKYLSKIRPDDGPEHYKRHLKATCFYVAASKIALGMIGLMMRKPSQLKASDRTILLSKSITPRNKSLNELEREYLREGIITNFTGLLVDHPGRDGFTGLNAANEDRKGFRPRVALYRGESILEVTEAPVGLNHQLVNVRLLENEGKRVRQLLINDDGFYEQRIYDADVNGQFDRERFSRVIPDINKELLTEIPFVLDTSDGGTCPTPSIIEQAVDSNLSHYELSGLLANMTWMTSGPMVKIIGFTRATDDNGNEVDPEWDIAPNGIIEIRDKDAEVDWFTFDPTNSALITDQLDKLESKLSTLNHSILAAEKEAPESPETIMLRRVAENATLAGFTAGRSESLKKALTYFARWVDGSEVEYSLNTDFTPAGITPAEHKELRDDYLCGAIPLAEYLKALQNGEVLDPTVDVEATAELAKMEQADRPTLGV